MSRARKRPVVFVTLVAAAVGVVSAAQAKVGQDPPEWTQPVAPFHIVGPIYYVGTKGIGVYLIRTSAGAILLDGGMPKAAPALEASITSLGVRMRDIKLIIATHAHFDHAGGLARLKRDSGGRFLSSAGDRQAFETGRPPSDTTYGVVPFAPVKVDALIHDGQVVRLGGVAMSAVLTPGHTPGCTSWTMTIRDHARPLRVVFPCSMSVAGNRLVGNRGYPGIIADYQATFGRMGRLRADVVLPAHPELADVHGREARARTGDARAFIDQGILPKMVADFRSDFAKDLRKSTHQGQPAS